jgi:hypothetical protein
MTTPRPSLAAAPRPRLAGRFGLGFLACLIVCAAVPADAAQVIRFKSGFELAVRSLRVEGDTVYVQLDGANEVGFPASTIESVQGDDNVRFSTGGPAMTKVAGRFVMGGVGSWISGDIPKNEKAYVILNSAVVRGKNDGKSIPVGFSFGNDDTAAFRSAPSGPVSASGKVGKGIREEGAKTHGGLDPGGQFGGGGVRTIKPSSPDAPQ